MSQLPRDTQETNGSHAGLPEPPQPPAPRTSVWPLIFAGIFAVLVSGVLFVLTLGAFGLLLIAAGGILLVAALHYFLWGRWLGEAIRREVAEEEAEEARRAALRQRDEAGSGGSG
ncbi:MAG: hypothetical protein KF708_22200 [Pirellulales bacterium]|nr:hypothetical protein [Pirellulales bacterium]